MKVIIACGATVFGVFVVASALIAGVDISWLTALFIISAPLAIWRLVK